ncbi:MAG TPA: hypothetical protein VF729_01735 [Solirubrobacterales bacterium]
MALTELRIGVAGDEQAKDGGLIGSRADESQSGTVLRRMQFELSRLDVMRSFESCYELWRRVTNPEYYQLEKYVEEATGKDIPAYGSGAAPGDELPEDWANAQRVIEALQWSLDFVSRRLSDEPTATEVKALEDGLEQGLVSGRQEVDSKVLQIFLNHLFVYVSELRDPDTDQIDLLVRALPEP